MWFFDFEKTSDMVGHEVLAERLDGFGMEAVDKRVITNL